jgi:hypothetical protein
MDPTRNKVGYLHSDLTKAILATERQRINGGLETTSRREATSVVNPSSITINDFPRCAIRNRIHCRSNSTKKFHTSRRSQNMSPNNIPRPDPPTELRDASKAPPGTKPGTRTSHRNCHDLIIYGRHDDYTWGFRLYRTAYSGPNADAEFNRAIEILHSYIRKAIFYNIERHEQLWDSKDPGVRESLDDAPEQQLWKRLRNDIVEDRALLEGASPARLNELHHEWLKSRSGKTMQNCRNRYFIILDEEVINNLLFLPPPGVRISPTIGMKVFDAEFRLPSSYFGSGDADEEDSDDDEEDEEVDSSEGDNYEGWFFTRAEKLKDIWFDDLQKERHDEVYNWDEESRPVRLA